MRLRVRCPCRVDLAGGTLDIWPLGLLHRGSITVNVAVPVWVRLEVDLGAPVGHVEHAVADEPWLRLGPEAATTDLTAAVCFALRSTGGVRVRVREQAPVGSGLGGSSSYAVALARAVLALEDRALGDRALADLLRDLEVRVLGAPTGVQDHWPAIRGGALALHLEPGGESVETLVVDPAWAGERLSAFFTGTVRHSGAVNWQIIRRRLDGDPETTAALEGVAAAARLCRQALAAQDEEGVAAAVAAEWSARKCLAREVCPPELERLERVAAAAGATAVKACGAGGGGTLALWHPAGARQAIVDALLATAPAGRLLASGITREGCQVLLGDEEPGPRQPS